MQIIKEITIDEVRATRASNAPFQIVLVNNYLRREKEFSLLLNADICLRYNIPMSLDLVGRILICSFESRELPLNNDDPRLQQVDTESLESDDLSIQTLNKNETTSFSIHTTPWKYNQVLRTLELSSFGGGDGVHLHILPCPFYRFILELTDEEYEACKALPVNSIFKVSFRLA